MSKNIEMPGVVIPPHQQSAPKEHWADKEIKDAAREIDEGRWMPDADPERDSAMQGLGLALGLGTHGVAVGDKPKFSEFQHTANLDVISRHPRVMEALEKMQHEVYDLGDPVKNLERNYAMRELARASSKAQHWDGQGRWEGEENEEMRHGKILTPSQFYDQLGKVVGKGKIKLSEYMVRESPEARSGRIALLMRNPLYKGGTILTGKTKAQQAEELRLKGEAELRRGKQLRRLAMDAEADKHINLAGEMAQECLKMMAEAQAEDIAAPAEFIRVGALQWPLGTEWMIMGFTEYGAVYKAKYLGWRTALLTMIRAGAITEKEAHKAFPVGSGPAASWYLEQLAMMRAEAGTVQ